jgi:small subunit ribosomal protein S2
LSKGGKLLFIGTKKQAQNIIFKEAVRSNQFYVNHRWLGGTLTNFKTVKKSVNRMKKLSLMTTDGTFDKLPKKEVVSLSRNLSKLEKNLSGIEKMTKLPKAILVVDPKREAISILEAKKLNIKVIATIDTNCDPDMIDYCIPSNDDSIRSIKLFVGKLADACIEGNAKYHKFLSQKKMVNQINVDSDKDNLFSKGSLRRKSLKVDIVHRTINVNDVKENEKILNFKKSDDK